MGLFDLFVPKTVSFRYKTLINLFKHTHSSFTITREEKNIVEFTLGYKKETLEYGSIEQYFDAKYINAGNFSYDFSKVVTVSLHINVDGTTVKVEKSFPESENQEIIYNTVMASFLKEIFKIGIKQVTEEENEENSSTGIKDKITTDNSTIFVEKWNLKKFAKMFTNAKIVAISYEDTGKKQNALAFTKEDGRKVFVNLFPNLEELTPQEITDKKYELYIGKAYFLFSKENKDYRFLPVEVNTNKADNKEYIIDDYSINQELTEDQKALLAIFLNKFTDDKNFHACKETFGIDLNSSVFRYWQNYYKGIYHYSNFGFDRKEYDKKMYNILATVKNIYAIHSFISNCCSYSYFLYTEDYIKDFTNILISWGFTEEEIDNIINRAKKEKYNEYKNYTDLVSFQDFVKIHGNIIKTVKAVDNQTGELFNLYSFVNFKDVYTYVVYCPYLGNLTLDEIEQNKADLYIRYGKEGCLYLCTKESELDRLKYIDKGLEYYDICRISDLEYLLIQLNVLPKSDAFTVEFIDELKLQ